MQGISIDKFEAWRMTSMQDISWRMKSSNGFQAWRMTWMQDQAWNIESNAMAALAVQEQTKQKPSEHASSQQAKKFGLDPRILQNP